MKVTKSTVAKIEIEPGDSSYDLYAELGNYGGEDTIAIVNGAIEVREND